MANYLVKFLVITEEEEFNFDFVDGFVESETLADMLLLNCETTSEAFTQAAQQMKKMAKSLKNAEGPIAFPAELWKDLIITMGFMGAVVENGLNESSVKAIYDQYVKDYGAERIDRIMELHVDQLDEAKYSCVWIFEKYHGAIEIIPHNEDDVIAVFDAFAYLY